MTKMPKSNSAALENPMVHSPMARGLKLMSKISRLSGKLSHPILSFRFLCRQDRCGSILESLT